MAAARRIDVHFHHIPQFYQDAVYEAGRGPAIGRYPEWSPELALEEEKKAMASAPKTIRSMLPKLIEQGKLRPAPIPGPNMD